MSHAGMNAETGRYMDGIEHIRQSIRKILTTPVGSRIMRRTFGSTVPDLVDSPINERTRLLVMSATATAVIQWEPRIRPVRVTMEMSDASGLTVELVATLRDGPGGDSPLNLSIPLGG